MKIDLAKLPVGEALLGAMLLATVVAFLAAFQFTSDAGVESGEAPPADGMVDGDGDGGPPPSGDLITMGDNYFEFGGEREPAIPVTAGEEMMFTLENMGSAIHNARSSGDDAELGTDDDAVSEPDAFSSGDTGSITVSFSAPGTYPFHCDFHPIDMVGTFVVE